MGKGDKKTKRGKIIMGTYGVRRPKKKAIAYKAKVEVKAPKVEKVEEVIAKPKKAVAKKTTTKKVEAKPKVEAKVKAESKPKVAAKKQALRKL